MDMSGPGSLKTILRRNKDVDEDKVEEEIISMLEEGHEQGVILPEEAAMISNIFDFSDMDVKNVMTPRQKVTFIDWDIGLEEALELMLEQGFSRYPVCGEDADDILGILHLKDAMKAYLYRTGEAVKDLAREALFVPPTLKISKLLSQMQAEKLHMAIVVDEYGQTEGVVALEDLLEVIVGSIFDEYDTEETFILRAGKDMYLMKGLTRLTAVQDTLGISFPDEDIETLNGFLLMKLGRLPMEDEQIEIEFGGYRFQPIDIYEKMIRQVKVTKLPDEACD